MHTYIGTYVCTYAYMQCICMYIRTYACLYVCSYVCMYVCYVYVWMHTQSIYLFVFVCTYRCALLHYTNATKTLPLMQHLMNLLWKQGTTLSTFRIKDINKNITRCILYLHG